MDEGPRSARALVVWLAGAAAARADETGPRSTPQCTDVAFSMLRAYRLARVFAPEDGAGSWLRLRIAARRAVHVVRCSNAMATGSILADCAAARRVHLCRCIYLPVPALAPLNRHEAGCPRKGGHISSEVGAASSFFIILCAPLFVSFLFFCAAAARPSIRVCGAGAPSPENREPWWSTHLPRGAGMVTQSQGGMPQLHIDFKNNPKKTIKKLIESKQVCAAGCPGRPAS